MRKQMEKYTPKDGGKIGKFARIFLSRLIVLCYLKSRVYVNNPSTSKCKNSNISQYYIFQDIYQDKKDQKNVVSPSYESRTPSNTSKL